MNKKFSVLIQLPIIFSGFNLCETLSDVNMRNTIQYFGNYYRTSCITLLYTEDQFLLNREEIHWLIYQMAFEIQKFRVTAMTYKYFVKRYKKWKKLKCNNPMMVITNSDDETKRDMEKISYTRMLHMTLWLMFMRNNSNIEEFFEKVRTPYDLRLIIAKAATGNRIEFVEIYRVANEFPLRTPLLGYWNEEDGYNVNSMHVYHRRKNMEGIVLKTGSTDNYPMHYFNVLPNGKTEVLGYFPKVWEELAWILNFSSVHFPSVDRVTGVPEKNGTWNGLVGMLQRREIDAAVSVFIMDEQRSHVIDFTRPLLRTSYQIFYKNLGSNFHWDAILRPFHTRTWMAVAAWIVVSSIFSWICNKYTHKYGVEESTKKVDFNLINSGFFFTKALCNQGHHSTPSAASSRIMFLTAYLVSGVLVPSYSAALIFFLTSRSPVRPFDSLSELLNLGTYRLQTISKTAQYTYFSNSTNPLLHKIYTTLMKIPEDELPVSTMEAMERVCKERNLVHFGDTANCMIYVDAINNRNGNCKILHFSREISPVYTSMGLTRDSPYRLAFNFYLRRIIEFGIVDEIERKTIPMKRATPKQTTWGIIETNDVLQVFVILITGMILSLIILLLEILHMRVKKHRLQKAQKPVPMFHINRNLYMTIYKEQLKQCQKKTHSVF